MSVNAHILRNGLWACLLLLSFVSFLHAADEMAAIGTKPQTGGATYRDSSTGMEFVYVKGGCYQMKYVMGNSKLSQEKSVDEVCVDDFYMGKYPVTQGQWKAVMGNNPSYFNDCGDNCPVEQVSWNDAQEFICKLNSRSGENKYRLPTEAEWEYAARNGGKNEQYAEGKDVESVAWYASNSGRKETHPVGSRTANGLGLYDMHGNIYEWLQDRSYGSYYTNSLRKNSDGPVSSGGRVVRGSSWGHGPGYSRTSPSFYLPVNRNYLIGFRLLRTQ